MLMLSLAAAQRLGYAVGSDPRVAITVPGLVVFVADRPWDDGCAKEAAAMVDWNGEALAVPPFRLGEELSP